MKPTRLLALLALAATPLAQAQPQLVTLTGAPNDISADGTVVVGAAGSATYRWVRSGGGATFTFLPLGIGGSGVTCSADGSVVLSQMLNTDLNLGPEGGFISGRWTSETGFVAYHDTNVFAGTGTPGITINVPRNLSTDGRYIVGFAYQNAAIGGYRPMIIDTLNNVVRNPGGITNPAARILCLSADATVLGGDDNITGSAARPAIWRLDTETGNYVGTVIEPGTGGPSGSTVAAMSADGSKATGVSYLDSNKLVRWEYDAVAGVYNKVILVAPTTPPAGVPVGSTVRTVSATAMSPDGNIIAGTITWELPPFSTFTRGFTWDATNGLVDVTSSIIAQGVVGLPVDGVVANITSMSDDGRVLVGGGGLGGAAFVLYLDGGVGCFAPFETPTTSTTVVSRCATSIILNANTGGSGPFTYQWRRGETPLVNGPSGIGSSTYTGVTTSQFRINSASVLDAGDYNCVVSNACGSFTAARTVTAAPADLYDTCETALETGGTGSTGILTMCGAYIDQSPATCAGTQRADVWIRFTASQAGDWRITTCGQSGFDTILSLYNTCGGPEIACSNDFCGTLASIERLTMTEGQSVLIRLSAGAAIPPNGVQVFFEFLPPPPANDLCANATAISDSGNYAWDNTYAGNDGSASCRNPTGKDVWFSFASPNGGTATFDTCGSLLNTVLTAFSSCGGPEIACNDNANVTNCTLQSRLTDVAIPAGAPVLVRISANTVNGIGSGFLNVSFTPNANPCLADFNGDGLVFPDDLSEFITCFFLQVQLPGFCPLGDFNGDGLTFPDDLSEFITTFFLTVAAGGC